MIHGVLNVQKEKGYTSHDVVAKLRGIVGQRKIGHTGTLDPDAKGVLPICLGRATKLCDLLTDKDKTYEAVLLLGRTTDTQDTGGRVLEEQDVPDLAEDTIMDILQSFVGEYAQIPPMYSAIKVNGRKLYELAREGKEIERKARIVQIYEIRVRKIELPRIWMEVRCSKGTYIRTLCHDIGKKLGCGSCMEELVRTRTGRFCLEDALTLEEIRKKKEDGSLMDAIVPVDEMFADHPRVCVSGRGGILAKNGNPLSPDMIRRYDGESEECRKSIRVYDEAGQFIAVYQWQEQKESYHVVKMFYEKV